MHLTDEQLNEYLDHETTDRGGIELHLSACADCAARLHTLQVLFDEIESLPEMALPAGFSARFTSSLSQSTQLPRSLTLTVTLQAVFAVMAIIIAAPVVVQFIPPDVMRPPALSFGDIFVQLQTQWTAWLGMLSQLQLPSIPQLPSIEIPSLILTSTLLGASLLWLVGNGLLLRKQMK